MPGDKACPLITALVQPRYRRLETQVSFYQMPRACQQQDTRSPTSAFRINTAEPSIHLTFSSNLSIHPFKFSIWSLFRSLQSSNGPSRSLVNMSSSND